MLRDYYPDDASVIHVMTRAEHSYRIALYTTSVSFLFQIVKFCLSILKMFIRERQMIHLAEVFDQSFTLL